MDVALLSVYDISNIDSRALLGGHIGVYRVGKLEYCVLFYEVIRAKCTHNDIMFTVIYYATKKVR